MIERFEEYLKYQRGYSHNTQAAYIRDLRKFASWMKATRPNARWSTTTREDVDDFIKAMVTENMKPATTNRYLASISGLYRFMQRQGMDVENPCKYESRRKKAKTLPNTIPASDLQAAYNASYGVVKTMLGLLITTGMRIQEMLEIRFEDIDFEDQRIRLHGKGGKERDVFSKAETLETLKAVKEQYQTTGYIFNMTQRQARYMIFNALKAHSDARQLSPHAIRHTFATNLAANGANVTTIAKSLGHNDISTTQKYIDMTQHHVKQLQLQFSII